MADTLDMTTDNWVAKWSSDRGGPAAGVEEGGPGEATRCRLPSQESVASFACRSRTVSVGVVIGS